MIFKRGPKPRPLAERLLEKVKRDPSTGCWVWQAAVSTKGYGVLSVGEVMEQAHRVSYKLFVDRNLSDELVLDHLCLNRRCVNPLHLEAVTLEENSARNYNARKTHCERGHELAGENLRISPKGQRVCRRCERERKQARKKRLGHA